MGEYMKTNIEEIKILKEKIAALYENLSKLQKRLNSTAHSAILKGTPLGDCEDVVFLENSIKDLNEELNELKRSYDELNLE